MELIRAAVRIAAEGGVEALTIENLAQAAGVTKGGVQYHFDSKDLLYRQVLEYMLEQFDEALQQRAPNGSPPGAWLHAYIDLNLGDAGDADNAVATLLAGAPVNDPRLEPFRRFAAKWKKRANRDGRDATLNTIIRLAADSLWMERIFLGATQAEIGRLKKRLHQLVDGGLES